MARKVQRVHDDNDGDMDQMLEIIQSEDGDIHIYTYMCDLRFRTPMIGGGASPRTWRALMDLMDAMELDNKERPQQ